MMSIARILKEQRSLLFSEFYKLLSLRSFYLLLLLLLLIATSMMIITFNTDLNKLLYRFELSGLTNKWMFIYSTLNTVFVLIFPFIVGLLVICITYMENVANGYSLLRRAPYSMFNIDIIKIFVIFIISILIFCFFCIFTILFSELFALFRPDFNLSNAHRKHISLLAYIPHSMAYNLMLAILFFLISIIVKNLPALVSIILFSPLLFLIILPDALNPYMFLHWDYLLNFQGKEMYQMSLHSPFVIKFSQINFIYIAFLIIALFKMRSGYLRKR